MHKDGIRRSSRSGVRRPLRLACDFPIDDAVAADKVRRAYLQRPDVKTTYRTDARDTHLGEIEWLFGL